MKKTILLASCILGLVVGSAQAQPQGNRATDVFVASTKTQQIADEIEALGTLQSNENIILTSTVTELVTDIHFDDGQHVEKGDVLVEMDAAEERADLQEEQAVFEEAEKQVVRLEPLVARGASSQSALDEKRREMQSSKARMEAITSRINQRIIKAPFSGVVGLRNISVGTLLQPGTDITTLDDTSIMKLDFNVPEVFVPALKQGASLEARTKTYPDEVFEAKLVAVDGRVDPMTRSVMVRAVLQNEGGLLKPGMLMRVNLQKNPREALVIPEESVVSDSENNFVYVVKTNEGAQKAVKTAVTLGTRRDGHIEVLSGLSEGDRVVTHGTLKINDGSMVKIQGETDGNKSVSDLIAKSESARGDAQK